MKRIFMLSGWLVLTACGAMDKKDGDTKESTSSGDIEFSGYVQKAFTIKVNNQEFADSEQFYTRFIEELVKPSYPDLAAKDVTVEGKYGLDEFGSNSKVFMSSMAADGHLYEGRTDAQSRFAIKVQSTALDETFKARVVVRVGLEIKQDGGDSLRYCYILHGNREGVAVSESSKPIIFDEFKTQLTTYKCEDVQEDAIVIPGAEGSVPSDSDVGAGAPQAKIDSVLRIQQALPAKYSGGAGLVAVAVGVSGETYIARSAVQDAETGKWCWPVVRLSSLSNPSESIVCVGETTDDLSLVAGIESLAISGGTLIATMGDRVASFAPDGSGFQVLQWSKANHAAVLVGDTLKAISGQESCDLTMVASEPASGCVAAPANKCDLGLPQTYAYHAGAIMAANGVNSQGSGYCGGMAIHALSPSLAYAKKYPLSALDIPSDVFAKSKLASIGNDLYLFSLVGSELQVRKVRLEN